jgi:uncharacterized membrane protein
MLSVRLLLKMMGHAFLTGVWDATFIYSLFGSL